MLIVVGQTISHYNAIEELGEGGMGADNKPYDGARRA